MRVEGNRGVINVIYRGILCGTKVSPLRAVLLFVLGLIYERTIVLEVRG